jgi:alpha-tubulin suppressor-like RCC1 family protein
VIAGTLSISPATAAVAPQMSIGAMQQTTCVIQDVGNMYCWGRNDLGQLGNGNVDPQTNPVQEATASTD